LIGAATLSVRKLATADAQAFDDFLLSRPTTLFYHSRKYAAFLSDLLDAEADTLVASDSDRIVGALPLMRRDTSEGPLYNSMPYFGSNGGVIANDDDTHLHLTRAYNDKVAGAAGGTVIANPLEGGETHGLVHNHSDYRIGQLTELDGGDILSRIDPSARRNVQKAARSGIEVVTDASLIGRLHDLHVENMTAIGGQVKSRRFFDLVPKHFDASLDYEIFGARKDGRIIAALLLFYFNRTVEYFTPAIEEAYRGDQPLSLLCHHAMTRAASRGFRWWNWGGTWPSQTGVYRFKRKWANIEQRYDYYVQLNAREVLGWTGERLREWAGGFYVVPFSALHQDGGLP
jgi:hypothetical protein